MFAQRKALENSEKSLSEFIPYSAVIAPGVVICREGDLVATVKISGKVLRRFPTKRSKETRSARTTS